jgi:hypothetical protein
MSSPPAELLATVRRQITEAYDIYVSCVSMPQMAISLETAAYIGTLAKASRSAVDFGSGFTSYVLRKYCDTVWSVDNSEEWLEKTREFVAGRRLNTDCMCLMADYPAGQHDLVVYDYSGGEERDQFFKFAFDQVAPGGSIVVDDMQFDDHAQHALNAAWQSKMGLVSCRDWTLDQFGRFAGAAVRDR